MNIITRKEIDQRALRWVQHLTKATEFLRKRQTITDEKAYCLVEESFWDSFLLVSNRMHCLYDELMLRVPAKERIAVYDMQADYSHVHAKEKNGMLLLCCPHPPKRRNDYYKGNRYILNHEISKVQTRLTLYSQKAVHIVNVYSQSNREWAAVLDFDNYDLKSMIDEACRIYPGSDNPLTTSIHLSTIMNDQLMPLTYLAITDASWCGDILDLILHSFAENGT